MFVPHKGICCTSQVRMQNYDALKALIYVACCTTTVIDSWIPIPPLLQSLWWWWTFVLSSVHCTNRFIQRAGFFYLSLPHHYSTLDQRFVLFKKIALKCWKFIKLFSPFHSLDTDYLFHFSSKFHLIWQLLNSCFLGFRFFRSLSSKVLKYSFQNSLNWQGYTIQVNQFAIILTIFFSHLSGLLIMNTFKI